jgi:dienelactone hydrolase
MDVYYPSEPKTGDRFPVVVMPFGFPDPESQIRRYGPATSWATLVAASGMAAVIYGAAEPSEDVHAVLQHLRTNAESLGLDGQRIGLLAASGNVPVALSALMRDTSLKCAALLCGLTMDLDGSTAIADAAQQFGFANACAGKSVDDLHAGVPLLFIRAGLEQFTGLNEALDKVIARAIARNLPVTVLNHPTGVHGFDLEEDTDASRAAIQLVLATLARYLR